MKPNREIVLSFLFSLACSCLLAVIFSDLLKTREQLANNSPIAFNSLLQFSRNLFGLQHSLTLYVEAIDNDNSDASVVEEYRIRFDIVWSTLSIFNLRVPGETTSMPEVPKFIFMAENFLAHAEPLIHADAPLERKIAINLQSQVFDVSESVYDIGHAFFVSSNSLRDSLNQRMTKLYRAISIFGLLFVASTYFLLLRLFFANKRSVALIKECRRNEKELAHVVRELRSGKLEQKAKDSFLAAASHDLRQPLHALGLFLGSLEKYVQPEGLDTLEKANQCSSALNRLLSSVLDLSKLDAGVVNVDATDFAIDPLIQSLIKEHAAQALQYNIELDFESANAIVYTDRVLLSRILRNLLDNALKHGKGSLVSLNFKNLRSHIRLTIKDDGTGIPESEHREIFSEYYQLGNPERDRTHGLGLGLSIVERLTNLLNLPLQFSSVEGKGSSFSLIIPVGRSNKATYLQQEVSHLHTQSPGKQNTLVSYNRPHRTIAVVEDQIDICLGMKAVLESYNYSVESAESASEMISKLKQQRLRPDAIVSDYRLRNHKLGDQAVMDMRDALGQEVPALIVTGDTSPKRVLEASQSGCTLLHKPVTPNDLVLALDELFAN